MEELFHNFIPIPILILELMGTIIITIAAIKAFYGYIKSAINNMDTSIRLNLAQSLALALEFKLASEILKTVMVKTMDELYILGAIILLRAILTFIIHLEIKGEKEKK